VRDGEVVLYVATNLEPIEAAVQALQRSLVIGTPLVLVLLAGGTWFVVGRALRPVEAMRRQVARISGAARGDRVPVPSTDEIGRLAITMNDMLDRLAIAAERERDFATDAAHELQSPLAALRSHLEVSLAHPERADWRTAAGEALAHCQQMEQLIRDLLFLARDEHTMAPTLVDLDDIVLTEAARVRVGTKVAVNTTGVHPVPVCGRADQLTRLTRNLLENAVRHARHTVTVTLSAESDHARLCVADDGRGVAVADRLRIFERFARTDDDRSRTAGGTGLGLAIVKDIAGRHGGAVTVSGQSGAVFTVTLPRPA
jgi:signal transduction histidine kinase